MSSVRFICGTQDIHKCLEQKIADFHSRDDAILYASCFAANGSLFEGILSDEDAVISDELNHASIIDGIRLCKAARHRYKHLNMEELEDILKSTQDKRQRLIATDGVFSMDGDIAPLGKIVDLAHKYNALTFIDDCHATGFFGPTGRGTEEHLGIQGKIDIINSTLGKGTCIYIYIYILYTYRSGGRNRRIHDRTQRNNRYSATEGSTISVLEQCTTTYSGSSNRSFQYSSGSFQMQTITSKYREIPNRDDQSWI